MLLSIRPVGRAEYVRLVRAIAFVIANKVACPEYTEGTQSPPLPPERLRRRKLRSSQ
jgi:hypothetical protein